MGNNLSSPSLLYTEVVCSNKIVVTLGTLTISEDVHGKWNLTGWCYDMFLRGLVRVPWKSNLSGFLVVLLYCLLGYPSWALFMTLARASWVQVFKVQLSL